MSEQEERMTRTVDILGGFALASGSFMQYELGGVWFVVSILAVIVLITERAT